MYPPHYNIVNGNFINVWHKALYINNHTYEPLMTYMQGKWKTGLKLSIQKTKFMASIPITSRKRDGKVEKRKDKKMDIVADFIFLSSKITVDSDCSHEIKRHLLLGRKAITNLDSVLKSRDITLPTKVHIAQSERKSLSHVRLFVTPWAIQSMELLRPE